MGALACICKANHTVCVVEFLTTADAEGYFKPDLNGLCGAMERSPGFD
jgi:hypothetical protein